MNPATLDSLLIDRELGELPAPVVELLDAYLTGDPAAAQRAAACRATVDLARRASSAPSPMASAPRPFDPIRLQRAHATAVAISRRREFYRLAACLALGAGLGWLLRPEITPKPGVKIGATAIARQAPPASAEPRSTFWSLAHLSQGRLASRPAANPFAP
jgi:anti-sigma factor RsiW